MSKDHLTQNQPREQNAPARRRRLAHEVHHHHHHYHGKPPREISPDGVPYDVVKGRIDARRRRNALLVLLLAPVFAMISWLSTSSLFAAQIALLIPVFLAGSVYFMDGLKESDYYQIQGSRFKDGGHRCIYCGYDRIWRHSPYKTNHTVADCANKACGKTLWKEPKS